MNHISFSLFADIMLWSTVPLWGVLGFFEHHLARTDTDHKLAQLILVVIMIGWAYMWNSRREYDHLAHLTSRDAWDQKIHPIKSEIIVQGGSTSTSGYYGRHKDTKNEVSTENVERHNVSNN